VTADRNPQSSRLTLVLGGGGAAAVAWEIGVLHGLAEHGLDLRGAERMIGTSAGAIVACRLTSQESLSALGVWAQSLKDQPSVSVDFPALMRQLNEIGARATDPRRARQDIGALAMAAPTGTAASRRAEIAALIGRSDWPSGTDLVVTAVDAQSGEFVAFAREKGIPLIDAVGASCAVPGVWPPVRVGEHVYVDGAVRSSVNASLAAGAANVLVLAPQSGPGGIERELRRLAAGDSQHVAGGPDTHVEVVVANEDSLRVFGPNPLDPTTSPAAFEAGSSQGWDAGASVERLMASARRPGVR
jgi:NTE family protein